MLTLQGNEIFLRALEPEDLELVFAIENDEEFWEVSANSTPYSRFIIRQYLKNSHKDIYEMKQLRLVVCKHDGEAIGLIDLFDFEPKHQRAAIGIIIKGEENRGKGYGFEALSLLCRYCFVHLALHQVYASVGIDNASSRKLFERAGFVQTGHKKDWNYSNGAFKDELLYQKINNVH